MIQAVYDKENHSLTMDGHAGAGPIGYDLVCSSASILAYTLGANVSQMEALGQAEVMHLDLQSGHAEIVCKPGAKSAAIVGLVFDAICVGFEMLARTYPQYISYKVVGSGIENAE